MLNLPRHWSTETISPKNGGTSISDKGSTIFKQNPTLHKTIVILSRTPLIKMRSAGVSCCWLITPSIVLLFSQLEILVLEPKARSKVVTYKKQLKVMHVLSTGLRAPSVIQSWTLFGQSHSPWSNAWYVHCWPDSECSHGKSLADVCTRRPLSVHRMCSSQFLCEHTCMGTW